MKASASILIAMYEGNVSVASAYNIAAETGNSGQNTQALKFTFQFSSPSDASTCKHPEGRDNLSALNCTNRANTERPGIDRSGCVRHDMNFPSFG